MNSHSRDLAVWIHWCLPILAVLVAIMVGAMVQGLSGRVILLLSIAIVLIVPLLVHAVTSDFDILDPIIWLIAAYFVMFFLRPFALAVTDSYTFRSVYNIESTFDEALGVALVGAVGLQIGYFSGLGRKMGRHTPALPSTFHISTTLVISLLMLIVVLYSFASIYLGGGGLNSTESTAYVYHLPYLVVPVCMLLLSLGRRYRVSMLSTLSYAVIIFFGIALIPTGRRLMLMQIVLAMVILVMIWRKWRPKFFSVILLIMVGFYLIVSMRDLRPGFGIGDAVSSTVAHIQDTPGSIETLLTTNDTEMFDGLALELRVVPEVFDYQPGSALYLLLTHPVPRLLWEDKPQSVENVLNAEFFNVEYGQAGVAYSVLGGFYFDSGLLGVSVGMAVLGIAFRFLWEYHHAHPDNDAIAMVYAASLPFVISILRGNLHFLLAIALFTVAPIIVVSWISGKRLRASAT